MTGADMREILTGLGMTGAEFGRCVGVRRDAVSHWATGRREIPRAVVVVLRLMALTLERGAPGAAAAAALRRAAGLPARVKRKRLPPVPGRGRGRPRKAEAPAPA